MKLDRDKLRNDFALKRRQREIDSGKLISFSKIAEEMYLDRVTLHRALTTRIKPSLKTIAAICKWIGNPVDEYIINDDQIFAD